MKIHRLRPNVIILVMLLLCASFASPFFWATENLTNLVRVVSLIGIVALGMNVVIISGGIDLSVGSVVALTGTLAASIWTMGYPLPTVLLVALLSAAVVGLINGVLVALLKFQPFVATLVTMTICRGAGLVYTNGQPIYADYPKEIEFLARGNLLDIPAPALIFCAAVVVTWYIMRFRAMGRKIYMIGANERAAYYGGISVWQVKLFTYLYCSLLAGIAGLVMTARMGSGEPGQAGVLLELDAIAAVVIGGTALKGGEGSVWGAVAGAFVIGILANLFNLLGIAPEWQNVSKGMVIVIAILVVSIGPKLRLMAMRKTTR